MESWEAEKLKTMQENFQVFACSGMQQHEPSCDGNCEIISLEGYDLEIAKESLKWDELGLHAVGTLPQTPIPGINVNTFHLEIAFHALLEIIQERGIATKEELDEHYAKLKLERMIAIREANEAKIKEARRRQAVGLEEQPQIVLPSQRRQKLQ